MIKISLPRQLLALTTLNTPSLRIGDAFTVQQALAKLVERHPMLKTSVFTAAGNLQTFVNVFVDGELADDLQTPIGVESEVQLVVAVAGG